MLAERSLTVARLRVRPLDVPIRRPLATSAGTVSSAAIVAIDLMTDDGPTGCAYIQVYAPWALGPMAQLIERLGEFIAGRPLAPLEIEERLQGKLKLPGAQGFTLMALAGLDMAAWDALAKARELPLASLLGGAPRPIAAYNSNGLGIIGEARAAGEARELVAEGFRAIKVRVGYPDAGTDLAVVRAVREAVGADVTVMADYNQALRVRDAIDRIRMLDDEGLLWVEEPVAADDAHGHADVRGAVGTAIQTGENWWGPHPMAEFLRLRACDYGMPDAMKIGGVTGWLRAAALAESAGLPLSSHLYPEISAHLLAVAPTRHYLEYVNWAEAILAQPLAIKDGEAIASSAPGSGISWNEEALTRYAV